MECPHAEIVSADVRGKHCEQEVGYEPGTNPSCNILHLIEDQLDLGSLLAMTHALTYFKMGGRAFTIRMALAMSDVKWEDAFLTFPELKAQRGDKGYSEKFPLGSVPVLTMPDGTHFCQSNALARWAGKKSGLYPREDDEMALSIDECMESCNECLSKAPQDSDVEKKKALREEYAKNGMPKYFDLFERRLIASGGPFYCGKDLTLADLTLWGLCDMIRAGNFDFVPVDFTQKWPRVHDLYDAVSTHPTVVKHMEIACATTPAADKP